jgi:hypothetical protein
VSRITLTPINYTRAGIVYPTAPAPSAGGTSWSAATGVAFQNNGLMHLWYYNGATPTAAEEDIGRVIQGQTFPATTLEVTIAATTYGAFGPLSPGDFLAQDGSGLTYVDFTNVTTLYVALYQLVPAT